MPWPLIALLIVGAGCGGGPDGTSVAPPTAPAPTPPPAPEPAPPPDPPIEITPVGRGISITSENQILMELMSEDLVPANPLDLAGRTLMFTPDGRGGYSREVRALDWEEEADDAERMLGPAEVELEHFRFPFAGREWDSFFYTRLGLISFGKPIPNDLNGWPQMFDLFVSRSVRWPDGRASPPARSHDRPLRPGSCTPKPSTSRSCTPMDGCPQLAPGSRRRSATACCSRQTVASPRWTAPFPRLDLVKTACPIVSSRQHRPIPNQEIFYTVVIFVYDPAYDRDVDRVRSSRVTPRLSARSPKEILGSTFDFRRSFCRTPMTFRRTVRRIRALNYGPQPRASSAWTSRGPVLRMGLRRSVRRRHRGRGSPEPSRPACSGSASPTLWTARVPAHLDLVETALVRDRRPRWRRPTNRLLVDVHDKRSHPSHPEPETSCSDVVAIDDWDFLAGVALQPDGSRTAWALAGSSGTPVAPPTAPTPTPPPAPEPAPPPDPPIEITPVGRGRLDHFGKPDPHGVDVEDLVPANPLDLAGRTLMFTPASVDRDVDDNRIGLLFDSRGEFFRVTHVCPRSHLPLVKESGNRSWRSTLWRTLDFVLRIISFPEATSAPREPTYRIRIPDLDLSTAQYEVFRTRCIRGSRGAPGQRRCRWDRPAVRFRRVLGSLHVCPRFRSVKES